MTSMPEAALARELGLAYAGVCIVANAAAGVGDGEITMDAVLASTARGVQALVPIVEELLTN